jgi:hypothetical protein
MKTLKCDEVYRNEYRDFSRGPRLHPGILEADLQSKTASPGSGIFTARRV